MHFFRTALMPHLCLYQNSLITQSNLSFEHVVPRSFLKDEYAKRDLHNIFLTDTNLNQIRSNYSYTDDEKIGYCGCNHKRKLFRPPVACRGVIARSCMYMHDVYGCQLPLSESLLNEWIAEPATAEEIRHNILCRYLQGNYNHHVPVSFD
jgi:endonuclease I